MVNVFSEIIKFIDKKYYGKFSMTHTVNILRPAKVKEKYFWNSKTSAVNFKEIVIAQFSYMFSLW